MWNSCKRDGAVEYKINMNHPLVISCLELPSKENLNSLIFAIENSLPIHSIYHDIADGSKTITTDWQKQKESKVKLKRIAMMLKEAKVGDEQSLSMLNSLLQSDSIKLRNSDLEALIEEKL